MQITFVKNTSVIVLSVIVLTGLFAFTFSVSAQTSNEIETCLRVPSLGYSSVDDPRAKCISETARLKNDINVCKQIDNLDLLAEHHKSMARDECVAGVAVKLKNDSLCDFFTENNERADCYTRVKRIYGEEAIASKDASLCHKSLYNDDPTACYRTIGFNLKNLFEDSEYAWYWIKTVAFWVLGIGLYLIVLYSYYRQIRNQASSQHHLNKLTIVGLIATVLLGISISLDIMFPPSGHPPIPLTFFTGIPLLFLSIIGALMIFKNQKLSNS